MRISFLSFSLVLMGFLFSAGSEAQQFDSVLKKLNSYYPQEKLYLHFDRPAYNAGETIWFKMYLFEGDNLSPLSKTVYVELLDSKGKLMMRKVAPVTYSTAASSFEIPADFTGSAVYVRAYTKWMLNFDSSFLYTKTIPVIGSKPVTTKLPPATSKLQPVNVVSSPDYFLQFFPEGGDLIEDVESRVAFKATDKTGMPVSVSGEIEDSKGTKIISFASVHDGMGKFFLQPKKDQKYKAVWKDINGNIHETNLPASNKSGVGLEVNTLANQVEFKINGSNASYPYVYVVAQINQQLLYRAKAITTKSTHPDGFINVENLPAGIVQVTLFTPDEKPIAERIVFINQSNNGFITDINTALKDPGHRKKNTIEIDVPDTLSCNLSVSVTDADVSSNSDDNIFSHVLLTSDIKGYVHNPAYYFSSDADSVIENLDLVMMTNGWRRFKWEQVLANHFPKINYLPEGYISIAGRMYGVNKSQFPNKEIVGILQLKNIAQLLTAPLAPDGKFTFPNLIFYDTAKFFYQVNNDKRKSLTDRASFDIKSSLLAEPLKLKADSNLLYPGLKPDAAFLARNQEIYQESLSEEELKKVKTLKEVVVTAKVKSKAQLMDDQYTSGFFSGGNSRMIIPEEDQSFMAHQNVLQYLQSRVAGLQISFSTPTSVTWRGQRTALFLNEVPQDGADLLESIPMSDIAMVKIFDPPFFGAFGGGGGGAIAVYLKKGSDAYSKSKGLDYSIIQGYSPVKEFYSPDYSKNELSITDYRATLYWNPFVLTDKDHRRIFLSFYNNDITKKFRVVIEGVNEEGKLTRSEKVIQ